MLSTPHKIYITASANKLTLKGGYLDFSNLTELKNVYITEIYMEKTIQIIKN